MKNKKISSIIVILTVIFTALIAISVSGCSIYKLNLPKLENIKSISIEQNANELVIDSGDEMENLLSLLNGNGRTTKTASVQDAPVNADKVLKVNFNFVETGVSTLFVYQKNGKYYIEQPYNGIFQISADDYIGIEGIIS